MPHKREVIPGPEEDLGRGGDASGTFPAGPSGEREELARELNRSPVVRGGPGEPDPEPPNSSH